MKRGLLVLGLTLLSTQGHAQVTQAPLPTTPALISEPVPAVLACGTVGLISYVLRWRNADNIGSGISSYILSRGRDAPGHEFGEMIQIAPMLDPTTGIFSARVDGFENDIPYMLRLVAIGPGGQSEPSNILHIPAVISGPCQIPPAPPTLIDAMIVALQAQAQQVSDGAADLAHGIAALREKVNQQPPQPQQFGVTPQISR